MNQSKIPESSINDDDDDDDGNHLNHHHDCIILYVMVVGFHHKKGCLIDYCYPSLPNHNCTISNNKSNCDKEDNNDELKELRMKIINNQDSIQLPECWKSLPSLAIPDGAHNFERDTVYFHLPDLIDPTRTVFGVACYQQIMTKILRVRTPDMTRSSVQKSVVAILTAPLYGLVERKLRIITRNYFQELDFSKTEILHEFYNSMALQLKPTLIKTNEIYHGLSLRNLFQKFGQQVIVLFKLLLLEKKTLFIMSPIRDLSGSILTLCSLFPDLLQYGMTQSHLPIEIKTNQRIKSLTKFSQNSLNDFNLIATKKSEPKSNPDDNQKIAECDNDKQNLTKLTDSPPLSSSVISTISLYDQDTPRGSQMDFTSMDMVVDLDMDFFDDDDDDSRSQYSETHSSRHYQEILIKPAEYYGLPLQLFKCHSYCLPYCSISCFECLNNPNVRSCLAGSSNSIFQRWENDIDVFVADNEILIDDSHLKRILTPTVEDLRFITFLMRAMTPDESIMDDQDDDDEKQHFKEGKRYQPESEDYEEYVENLEQNQHFYKGSDAWCRYHFKNYLIHMLRCSFMEESNKEYRAFNAGFISEWKQTYSYKHWLNSQNDSGKSIEEIFLNEIEPQHPFTANRLNDIRFKITNFLSNRQEHINNASKVVLSTAKSTFSSWMSSLGSYHMNAGQQAKSFINKTVQFANQLIENPDDQSDNYNNKREPNMTTSSSLDDDERKRRYRHRLAAKTNSSTKQRQQSNQKWEHSSKGFNLDESDPDVEEQETSV
ncbi:late secretory pathway protein AVL9 homolog [Dermatophagoides farinae]|uniref:late secretory pathway protein AVL9 homolog n=1 Tax=Dermatophagoides farinae TaxID=6954 RepID=UPI003F62F868